MKKKKIAAYKPRYEKPDTNTHKKTKTECNGGSKRKIQKPWSSKRSSLQMGKKQWNPKDKFFPFVEPCKNVFFLASMQIVEKKK